MPLELLFLADVMSFVYSKLSIKSVFLFISTFVREVEIRIIEEACDDNLYLTLKCNYIAHVV